MLKRNECIFCSPKSTFKNVHALDLAAIQMSINRRIDKYLMKFLPDEILHRNKRAEKKLAQKSYVLYDFHLHEMSSRTDKSNC